MASIAPVSLLASPLAGRPLIGVPTTGVAPPIHQGAGWRIYDETTAPNAIVDAINGAQHVVNAEFFGITDAGKGAAVIDALVAAAERGVEVNVIADMASQITPPFGSFRTMRKRVTGAGGHVIVTSPIPYSPRARATPGLAHVDHRKVVTVDGTRGFIGGMNLIKMTDDYKDSMVELTGIAAARLAAEEQGRWSRVGGVVTPVHAESVKAALRGAPPISNNPRDLRIIANAPDERRHELSDGYAEMIRTAKRRVWISTPAISDRSIMREIVAAAARGVDVRILTPGGLPLGVPFIQWIARAHLSSLVGQGGKAYEIPEVLHRKAIIADDEVILSSYNLTGRSRKHDHEVGIRTTDPAFVSAISAMLASDMRRSTMFDPSTFRGLDARIGALIAKYVTY